MGLMGRRRFSRDRRGRFHVGLDGPEQELLKSLPRQAQDLLERDDPATARVFPVAYAGDAGAEAEYRAIMGTQLLLRHQRSLDTLAATADATTIDESEIHQWLDAVEVLRLVLGTQLDVTEATVHIDERDPRFPQYAVYHYLSLLQEQIVEALASTLPSAGIGQGGQE